MKANGVNIALLLIFNLLAISREVILAFSDISCRMASRVSGPPFWSTFLLSLFFFECEVIIHRFNLRQVDFLIINNLSQISRPYTTTLPSDNLIYDFLLLQATSSQINTCCLYAFVSHEVGKQGYIVELLQEIFGIAMAERVRVNHFLV